MGNSEGGGSGVSGPNGAGATRGLGAVVTPTSQKQGGDPIYWLSEVLPRQQHAGAPATLELREPSVFFGEQMAHYVVVGHGGSFSAAADQLEGTESAVAFASGMAALSAVLLARASTGLRHVVAVRPL